jgi:hypothetical protein
MEVVAVIMLILYDSVLFQVYKDRDNQAPVVDHLFKYFGNNTK